MIYSSLNPNDGKTEIVGRWDEMFMGEKGIKISLEHFMTITLITKKARGVLSKFNSWAASRDL